MWYRLKFPREQKERIMKMRTMFSQGRKSEVKSKLWWYIDFRIKVRKHNNLLVYKSARLTQRISKGKGIYTTIQTVIIKWNIPKKKKGQNIWKIRLFFRGYF